MIDDVYESSIRLIEIVNDFLDTSRLELGKMEFKKDALDLSELIPRVIKEYQVTSSRNKIYINFEDTINLKTEANFVKVLVTDTGIGIPQDNQKLLFRKFQQAESNIMTRDGSKGTGLGLYISKMIIEGMRGKIQLESLIEGKGTIFSFTLPIACDV